MYQNIFTNTSTYYTFSYIYTSIHTYEFIRNVSDLCDTLRVGFILENRVDDDVADLFEYL